MDKPIVLTIFLLLSLASIPSALFAGANGFSDAEFFYGISMEESPGRVEAEKDFTQSGPNLTDTELSPANFFGYIDAGDKTITSKPEMNLPANDRVQCDAKTVLPPAYFYGYVDLPPENQNCSKY